MGKFISLSAIFSLLFINFGVSHWSSQPIFMLASPTASYAILRLVLAVILAYQAVTRPPRNLLLRIVCGTISLCVASWTLVATYSYQMYALDSLLFALSSISIGIAVLESRLPAISKSYSNRAAV